MLTRISTSIGLTFAFACASMNAVIPFRRLPPEPPVQRSPSDLALSPDGHLAISANTTADSVSLVDLVAGHVVADLPCGRRPTAVAWSPDGRRAAVSNWLSDSVTLLECSTDSLRTVATVPVGDEPRTPVFAPDGNSLYVAVSGANEVVAINVESPGVVARIPVGDEPRSLSWSEDGKLLHVGNSRSATVCGIDVQVKRVVYTEKIPESANLRGLAVDPASGRLVLVHVVRREFPVSRENIDEGWVIDNRLTRMPIAGRTEMHVEQVALDTRGDAVGDPHGVAFSPDGQWLVVTAAGTHELLIFKNESIPWNSGDPGDHIKPVLLQNDGKFRRVKLGGRPMGVAFAPDSRTAVVANYLLDSLQVVDVSEAKLLRTIHLGGPAEPSLVRRGEVIFYDADRSHGHWFSCHTCHVDGHTNGLTFDTLNDDSYGNPKLTPTLRGVTKTGPWTWHGWQKDLTAAMTKSLTTTMFGPEPTPDDARALIAFLETLEHPPNPNRLPDGSLHAAAARGESVFSSDAARCASCHKPPLFSSTSNYDVRLGDDGSPYSKYNPPSLLGVYARGPYLHDARAQTLQELLEMHHKPEMLGGKPLSPERQADLIAFLNSL